MTSQSLEEPITTPTIGEATAEDSLTTPEALDALVLAALEVEDISKPCKRLNPQQTMSRW
jgi:hypothetical protein